MVYLPAHQDQVNISFVDCLQNRLRQIINRICVWTGIFHFRAKFQPDAANGDFAVLTCVSAGELWRGEYLQTLQFIVAIAGIAAANCNSDAAVGD